jgi:dTMP kinase
MFFSFDGIDGVGKSTQVRMFDRALRSRGLDIVVCRDPGSTALGERIRELLLSCETATPMSRRSEMLLYMASRAQLVEEIIKPALAAGRIVVSDRYLLANVVYQGHAGGLNPEQIWSVGLTATDAVMPDCVFVLDMAVDGAIKRLNRSLDRMENQGDEYRDRLRQGFLDEAARAEGRIHVIGADQPVDVVHAQIWRIAAKMLGIGE